MFNSNLWKTANILYLRNHSENCLETCGFEVKVNPKPEKANPGEHFRLFMALSIDFQVFETRMASPENNINEILEIKHTCTTILIVKMPFKT